MEIRLLTTRLCSIAKRLYERASFFLPYENIHYLILIRNLPWLTYIISTSSIHLIRQNHVLIIEREAEVIFPIYIQDLL